MKGRGKLHRAWWMMVGCILLQAGGGFARPFGEAATCQRTVRRERNAIFPAEGYHFPLLLPEDEVIMPLYRDEFAKSLLLG